MDCFPEKSWKVDGEKMFLNIFEPFQTGGFSGSSRSFAGVFYVDAEGLIFWKKIPGEVRDLETRMASKHRNHVKRYC